MSVIRLRELRADAEKMQRDGGYGGTISRLADNALDACDEIEFMTSELARAREQLAGVRALVEHARKISDSPSMTLYCVDVERTLALIPSDTPTPHKTGANT